MNVKKKGLLSRVAACSMAMLVGISLSACGGGQSGQTTAKIAVIGQSEGIQFWDYVQDGATQAAEELGYEVTYVNATSINDVDGQIQLVKTAINDGANAIVVAPNDQDKLNDVLRDATDKGIKVLTIDADVSYNGRLAYIGTMNTSGGAMAARQAAAYMTGDKDKAAIIGHSNSASTAIERIQGFQMALEGIIKGQAAAKMAAQAAQKEKATAQPADSDAEQQGGAPEDTQQGDVQNDPVGADQQVGTSSASEPNPIASIQYCDGDADVAKQMARELLTSNDNIKVIYTTNERSTVGVCEAVEELGLSGQVHVFGFNSNSSEINYIKSGTLTGTIVQNPYNMGYLGVFYAGSALRGDNVKSVVDTGVTYVNADNLNNDEIQLLLDPAGYMKGVSE